MYRTILNQNVYNTDPTTIYKTLSEVREYINSTYFHGLDIVKNIPCTLWYHARML